MGTNLVSIVQPKKVIVESVFNVCLGLWGHNLSGCCSHHWKLVTQYSALRFIIWDKCDITAALISMQPLYTSQRLECSTCVYRTRARLCFFLGPPLLSKILGGLILRLMPQTVVGIVVNIPLSWIHSLPSVPSPFLWCTLFIVCIWSVLLL